MLAEIITIGDEILIGQIVDTNSAWMAQKLNLAGIMVKQITSVSDEKQHILDSLKLASHRADIILITGGLGPTKDDITKKHLQNISVWVCVQIPGHWKMLREFFPCINLRCLIPTSGKPKFLKIA
jgi:nicotinamide-nucleotide amidase